MIAGEDKRGRASSSVSSNVAASKFAELVLNISAGWRTGSPGDEVTQSQL